MKQIKNVIICATIFLVLSVSFASAKETPIKDLHEYTLDNGLSLFVAENHSVPLVYVDIAVRAGATTQTPETAGLFHLYEHMMFKGNDLYRNSAAVQRAVKDMGVAKWNAYTGIDCVHYFVTVPTDQLENSMAFWNAAIRSPLMDPGEFENEKKVVLSEIAGDYADPSEYFMQYMHQTLFPDAPYRLDPSGAEKVVKNATIVQLRDIQATYYIPLNAALFIGGDVHPEEVFGLAKTIFGNWSNNGRSAPKSPARPTAKPLAEARYAVIPVDKMSSSIAQIAVIFRGPDYDGSDQDTLTTDYMAALVNDRKGSFKQSLYENNKYQIPSIDDVNFQTLLTRSGSVMAFSANVRMPYSNLPKRSKVFQEEIRERSLPALMPKYNFDAKKQGIVTRWIRTDELSDTQSAAGILAAVRDSWASASVDYYYTYFDRLNDITRERAQQWLKTYITEQQPLICVIVSADRYKKMEKSFKKEGFEVVTADKAFWWKNSAFAPDPAHIVTEANVPAKTAIYVPQKENAASKKYMVVDPPVVETKYLDNKVPVYIMRNDSTKLVYLNIALRGGVQNFSAAYSGLERAMFESMLDSSRIYNRETRSNLMDETRSTISTRSYNEGSVLRLETTDDYLYQVLPVFINGFEEPKAYTVSDSVLQDVASIMTDPLARLRYDIMTKVSKGHPYETRPTMTPLSYEALRRGYWEGAMGALAFQIKNATNLFIVASGNVDGDKLVKELNATLGKWGAGFTDQKRKYQIPPYTIEGDSEVITLEEAAGTGYGARVVSAPAIDSDDYVPFLIATDMYNDILYNVVREHYGVCYTPSATIASGKASLGMELLYKMSDLEHFAGRVQEARDYMMQGKLIDSIDDMGKYVFSSIEDRLLSYKNAQIIATYSSQETIRGMANELVYDLLTYNEMFHSRNVAMKIHDTTAEQVETCFKKYWVDGTSKWWVLVGPDDKEKVRFE